MEAVESLPKLLSNRGGGHVRILCVGRRVAPAKAPAYHNMGELLDDDIGIPNSFDGESGGH